MNRREFIAGLGSAAVWPLLARGQQPAMPLVGYLASSKRVTPFVTAFQRGLSELGYVEGKNVAIEYSSAEGQFDRLPALATELIQHRAAVIVAPDGLPAALAAKAATDTIPIVFIVGSDPVAKGLVASLSRPGGNATGMTVLATGLIAKRLAILHRVVPAAMSIALLLNPSNSAFTNVVEDMKAEGQMAARSLGLDLLILNARTEDEIKAALVGLAEQHVGALLVGADPLFRTHNDQIVALTARYAIPTSFESAISTTTGGLMSYGTDLAVIFLANLASTRAVFSGVRNRPTCRCYNQPSSSSSTSRPPRRSASKFRATCSLSPTR